MDDAPTITLLEALKAELADYERRRAAMAARPPSAWRDANLKAWQWSIGVKRAQIEREQQRAAAI